MNYLIIQAHCLFVLLDVHLGYISIAFRLHKYCMALVINIILSVPVFLLCTNSEP